MSGERRSQLRIAILGAGASGLNMAIRLKQSGFTRLTLFEKGDRVGGTWRDNTYPGSGCDVPSHLYSYSFEPKHDWSRKFAEQPEILAYFEHCAQKYGITPHIRFNTEVAGAEYDDESATWRLRTADGETYEADVFIAATGQLNRPLVPDLPGLADFEGASWHSARWDHDHDLTGDDVAVVGNGASAVQFVPVVAERAKTLTVFQRTANYVGPKKDRPFTAAEKWAFAHVPGLDRLYRWAIYWQFEARFLAFRRDSAIGRTVRERFVDELAPLVSDRLPESAVVPDYPVGCKRILISNDYYPALQRPNVRVVQSPIARVTAGGLVTADGEEHHADTLVFATGFDATNFLGDVTVSGTDGVKLRDVWRDGAEAYLGMAVPGFPNFFMLYGPNTNLGHNSILFMVERQVEYVLTCLADMVEHGARSLEVRREVFRRFEERVQRRMQSTVWAAGCRSWYKTASGRVTQNWPTFTVAYWRDTVRPRMADFVRRG